MCLCMCVFQIVTWKRYNDFKNLYKAMVTLHKALHRRDTFPVFAKPKVFGETTLFFTAVCNHMHVCFARVSEVLQV